MRMMQLDVTRQHWAKSLEDKYSQNCNSICCVSIRRKPVVSSHRSHMQAKSRNSSPNMSLHVKSKYVLRPYPSLKTKHATAQLAPARTRSSSSMIVPLMKVTRLSIKGSSNTSITCRVQEQDERKKYDSLELSQRTLRRPLRAKQIVSYLIIWFFTIQDNNLCFKQTTG